MDRERERGVKWRIKRGSNSKKATNDITQYLDLPSVQIGRFVVAHSLNDLRIALAFVGRQRAGDEAVRRLVDAKRRTVRTGRVGGRRRRAERGRVDRRAVAVADVHRVWPVAARDHARRWHAATVQHQLMVVLLLLLLV